MLDGGSSLEWGGDGEDYVGASVRETNRTFLCELFVSVPPSPLHPQLQFSFLPSITSPKLLVPNPPKPPSKT